jgi:hypothetical protein
MGEATKKTSSASTLTPYNKRPIASGILKSNGFFADTIATSFRHMM